MMYLRTQRRLTAGVLFSVLATLAGGEAPPAAQAPTTQPADWQSVRDYDFSGKDRDWTGHRRIRAPKTGEMLLGLYTNNTLNIAIPDLPEHSRVRLRVDLVLIRSWDGSDQKNGPDFWEVKFRDGPTLLSSTFVASESSSRIQSFPDDGTEALHPGGTGASEINQLGFTWSNRQADAVYPIDIQFRHTGPELRMTLSGRGLSASSDEAWAIRRLRIDVAGAAEPLDQKQLDQLLADLDPQAEPLAAFRATWRLGVAGPAGQQAARAKLAELQPDQDRLESLIDQLDAPDWPTRAEATEALKAYGEAVKPVLEERLEQIESLEVRARIREVLRNRSNVGKAVDLLVRRLRKVLLLQSLGK